MARMDGSLIQVRPTTQFGRWLKARCDEHGWETFRQVAEYTKVSHAQIRSYLVEEAHPRPPTTRRLAKALKTDERELLRIVAVSEAVGPDPPPGAGHDSRQDRPGFDMLSRDAERKRLIGEVAMRLLRGDSTQSVGDYLLGFEADVDADAAAGGGRDAASGGGSPGSGDPP